MVLADKGYHTGAELQKCQSDNMLTHVAYKEQPSVKHIATDFLSENFNYDKTTDSYICPAGAPLSTPLALGTIKKARPMKPVTVLKLTAPMLVKPAH